MSSVTLLFLFIQIYASLRRDNKRPLETRNGTQ